MKKKQYLQKKKRVVHKVGKKKKDVYKSVFYTLINLYIIYYITTTLLELSFTLCLVQIVLLQNALFQVQQNIIVLEYFKSQSETITSVLVVDTVLSQFEGGTEL